MYSTDSAVQFLIVVMTVVYNQHKVVHLMLPNYKNHEIS